LLLLLLPPGQGKVVLLPFTDPKQAPAPSDMKLPFWPGTFIVPQVVHCGAASALVHETADIKAVLITTRAAQHATC
jgi:hypothetical protein